LRGTRYLKCLSHDPQRLVDIGEFKLDIRVGNAPQRVELGASTGDAANSHLLKCGLKRILIAIAPVDGLDMLVHASENQVRKIHDRSGRMNSVGLTTGASAASDSLAHASTYVPPPATAGGGTGNSARKRLSAAGAG